MKNLKYIFKIIYICLLFSSCAQEVIDKYEPVTDTPPPPTEPTPSSGEADFTKYVAVGNSLTAGYMNGALYTAGQNTSLAAQLAKQFALAGGGAFNQPDINSENGFFGVGPDGTTILGRLRLSAATNAPAPIVPGDRPTPYAGDKATLNNFGVPGITLGTALIPQTGGPYDPENPSANPAFNPLYARFASNPGTSTIIGDAATALANGGTFFTFWLGNNDVLGYAVGGASNPGILTSTDDFQQRFQIALGALLQASPQAKGMVVNIPNVIDIPYFKTIPYNPVPLTQDQADQLNTAYAQFNAGVEGYNAAVPESMRRTKITFAEGQNAFIIEDEDLADSPLPKWRLTTPNDLVTLRASAELSKGFGTQQPMPDAFILTPQEQEVIQLRINDFNTIISNVVTANTERVGLVNMNEVFQQFAQTGFVGDNIFITAALAPPFGAFSLDGVHPNSRGYTYTANRFIEAINQKFNATVPLIKITSTQGNELPQP
ncbi:MAG: SGNH/GDSL hydrolase family protein [Bacteroidota bacterium]|nr:SGNH/GDSL hydrolase family protein [Bacteroidota bacterium]